MSTLSTVQSQAKASAAGNTEIRAAEQDHREAQAYLTALEERVRAGDADVHHTELREARDLVKYAELRIEAAKRRAAQIAVEARQVLYAQLAEDAALIDELDDEAITDAFAAARVALRKVYDLAEARSVKVRDLSMRADAVVDEAKRHDELGLLRAAGIWSAGGPFAGQVGIRLTPVDGQGRGVADVSAWQVTAAVLGQVLDAEAETIRRATGGGPPPWSGNDFSTAQYAVKPTVAEFPGLDG
jgi:hypothetical protein